MSHGAAAPYKPGGAAGVAPDAPAASGPQAPGRQALLEVPGGGAGEAGPLGLHGGLSEGLAPEPNRCTCKPEHLRLLSEHGELVHPRGKAVNRCAYCAKLAAIENAEMLWLDAMEGDAPEVWMVLGTRTATVDMETFYVGLAEVKRKLRQEPARDSAGRVLRDGRKIRRRWPAVEYACCLEYTTGHGPRSGGRRRPHWNLLLKGIPAPDAAAALTVAAAAWCEHVDAERPAQHATSVYEGGGLIKYLALHFCKESQLPPENFRGQRFNCSRGYFTGCTRATARARARDSLAFKRELWKVSRRLGPMLTAEEVDELARENHRANTATRWTLANERGARLGPELPRDELQWRLFLAVREGAGLVDAERLADAERALGRLLGTSPSGRRGTWADDWLAEHPEVARWLDERTAPAPAG